MRVAIVFEYPTVNGGENSMFAVIDWLLADADHRDVEFVALCPRAGAVRERLDALGIETVEFDRHAAAGEGPRANEDERAGEQQRAEDRSSPRELQIEMLCRCVTGVRPDVVHANSLATGRLSGAAVGRLPCPATAHLRDIVKLSKAAIRDLNQNSRLIAVSEATRTFHVCQGLTTERSCVIHNGVSSAIRTEAQYASRERIRAELGIPIGADVLLTVGQIGLRKGLDMLADTAKLLAAEERTLHWLVVGERFSRKQETIDFEHQVFATFQQAAPIVTVHRLGYRRDVADLMLASDLLVHGARQEPLGRVLLEAASLKLAVIATDVGGTREIFKDGVSGLLVRTNDPGEMADAIRRLITDPGQRRQLAEEAALRVTRDFSIERSAQQLLALWRSVEREEKSRPEA